MTKRSVFLILAVLGIWLLAAPPCHAGLFGWFGHDAKPEPAAAVAPESEVLAEEDLFSQGYQLFAEKDYLAASSILHRYLQSHSFDDENYEWAMFFFGLSLHELNLSHAAVDTLSYLVTKKPNAKIVAYSLELLEQISRSKPFDREQVVLDVLSGQELGFVDDQLQDFINYYQGLFDWEHGYADWGKAHFSKIRPQSYYYYKYLYQKALYQIYSDRIDSASELLGEILAAETLPSELKDEARITLARILFEKNQYRKAFLIYQDIEKPNVEQAKYLLERAWTQYRLGKPEKAMGLLYAFEAPNFWQYFTPEYYILKSFIYKDVCHYNRALNVVEDFHRRYDETLEFIYARGDVTEHSEMLVVMMEKRQIKALYRFLRLLEQEQDIVNQIPDPELSQYLQHLYAMQWQETSQRLKKQVESEYERLGNELLQYEEEAHLMEYEIGLDMYQRASDYHYSAEEQQPDKETEEKTVAFSFQGEFWNDELDDFEVVLENKCDSLEEWDIFFK